MNLPIAAMQCGRDGRIQLWNAAAERTFGWTEAEVLGQDAMRLLVPERERPTVEGVVEVVRRSPDAVLMQNANLTRDRGEIICSWVNSSVLDPAGDYLGFVCIAIDVSERERMAKALGESEARYRAMVEASRDGVWILDEAGRTTFANQRAAELVGASPDALRGGLFADCLSGEDRPAVLAALAPGQQGARDLGELRLRRADGKTRWVLAAASPMPAVNGDREALLLVLTDVTERRALQEQFLRAQKMDAVGRLAGGIAHDFNNLLTLISGYTEILLDNMPSEHPDRELVEDIRGAGERAETLTRQLLAMSRQTAMEPRVVDLNTVLAESDRMFRRIIGEDVSLCTALAPDLWRVRVDPARFDQVMLNLVVNARDAMPEGGRLTIETANVLLDPSRAAAIPESEPGEYVLVAVSDTGIGMNAEIQARVFEPFYTTKGTGRGTGLGMATAYGIVRQTGGHIAVYSEVGVGTVFKVYLPRVNGEGEVTPPPKVERQLATGEETILLVEDEDGVRSLTARVLQRAGYRVFSAANGHEALALAEERGDAIDLLVTDVIMPQMNGRQLAERLLERWPGLRVLYVSGYTDDAVLRHGVLRAEVAFLQKPYLPSALTNKIRSVLDGPHGKRN